MRPVSGIPLVNMTRCFTSGRLYTICVLSYLLDVTIANRLKEVEIGINSLQKVYEVLKDGIIGKITMKSTGDVFLKLISLNRSRKRY